MQQLEKSTLRDISPIFRGDYDIISRDFLILSDSNNKEVYEQDIVEHTCMQYQGYGNVGEITEVVLIEDIRKLPFDDSSIGVTVIGNTHLNPELLN